MRGVSPNIIIFDDLYSAQYIQNSLQHFDNLITEDVKKDILAEILKKDISSSSLDTTFKENSFSLKRKVKC